MGCWWFRRTKAWIEEILCLHIQPFKFMFILSCEHTILFSSIQSFWGFSEDIVEEQKHFHADKKINRMRIIMFSSNSFTHPHMMFRDFVNCYLSGPTGRDKEWDSDLIRMTEHQQSAVPDRPNRDLWCYSVYHMRSSRVALQRFWTRRALVEYP